MKMYYSVYLLAIALCANASAANYYVASNGNDSNPGSLAQPFATIGKAADVMVAGDSCYIRGGLYREEVVVNKSGTSSARITFSAYGDESVTVTGLDLISNWTVHSGAIYKKSASATITQLFSAGTPMNLARWPNTPANLLSRNNATVDTANMAPATGNPWIEDAALPARDWTGARIWMLPGAKWGAVSSTIVSQSGNRLFLASNPSTIEAMDPDPGTDYYIYDTLAALDSNSEYWYDSAGSTLYFRAPNGVNPNTLNSVEGRTRLYSFSLGASSYVTVRNIKFHAATLKAEGTDCIIEYCTFHYPTPHQHAALFKTFPGVVLNGSNNTIRFCEVAYSWGDGITTQSGSSNNVVENNLIHDCNWLASWSSGITTTGSNHSVLRNTVYNTGRDGIRFYAFEGGRLNYNHVFDYGYLAADLGAMKTGNAHTLDTEIAYNWVHDERALASGNGIYLDAGTDNFLVHHNVAWNTGETGLRSNKDGFNNRFYNNTISGVEEAMRQFKPNGEVYVDVVTRNNISTVGSFLGNVLSNNKIDTAANFAWVGSSYGDFRLRENSSAINFGTAISGITDGFVGTAPDAGAFEYGGSEAASHWLAGITWNPASNSPPVGLFAATSVDLVQTFNASASFDPDGSIIRYFWEFGDGSFGGGSAANHTYSAPGNYKVSLTVNDLFGGSNRVSKWIGIQQSTPSVDLHIDSNGTKTTAASTLVAGRSTTSSLPTRAFLNFTIPTVPAESRLLEGWIGLYQVAGPNNGYGFSDLYRIGTPWTTSSVGFNHTLGSLVGRLLSSPAPVNAYYSQDITSLLGDHYSGLSTNHGFSIRGSEQWGETSKHFSSKEGDASGRPLLSVTYETPTAYVSEARTAPVAFKYFAAQTPAAGHGPKKGSLVNGQPVDQAVGQSFEITAAEAGLSIDRLSLKVAADLDLSGVSGEHTMLIAFMRDTDGNGSLEARVGPVFEAELSGRLIKKGNYLTFSLDQPITLASSGTYGFTLYWKQSHTAHSLIFERAGSDTYPTGKFIYSDLTSNSELFPVVTTPSGSFDFTFYID